MRQCADDGEKAEPRACLRRCALRYSVVLGLVVSVLVRVLWLSGMPATNGLELVEILERNLETRCRLSDRAYIYESVRLGID
jgi:hypothetical protein